jgi:predicted  nucleic acid-binding Zn-ribbon protein
MSEPIEKLLVLQERDKNILHVRGELARIGPEQQSLQKKHAASQAALDQAKNRLKQIESERKRLEGEVTAKKQQIEKYSLQQFQTKKNEEYRALAQEIEHCKIQIVSLEDQQIEQMEKAETAQKEVQAANRGADEAKKAVDSQLKELIARETNLKATLSGLESDRAQLTQGLDPSLLGRYEHILKQKGGNAVVGIAHGVCSGCHMRLPAQPIVSCQAHKDIVTCPNCGRILFHSADMDMTVAD